MPSGAARDREGGEPDHVVLTRPANWGVLRRGLFDDVAAAVDGPDLLTVTEPQAVAAYFAATERLGPGEIVAVYDLGGGSFEATVLARERAAHQRLRATTGRRWRAELGPNRDGPAAAGGPARARRSCPTRIAVADRVHIVVITDLTDPHRNRGHHPRRRPRLSRRAPASGPGGSCCSGPWRSVGHDPFPNGASGFAAFASVDVPKDVTFPAAPSAAVPVLLGLGRRGVPGRW